MQMGCSGSQVARALVPRTTLIPVKHRVAARRKLAGSPHAKNHAHKSATISPRSERSNDEQHRPLTSSEPESGCSSFPVPEAPSVVMLPSADPTFLEDPYEVNAEVAADAVPQGCPANVEIVGGVAPAAVGKKSNPNRVTFAAEECEVHCLENEGGEDYQKMIEESQDAAFLSKIGGVFPWQTYTAQACVEEDDDATSAQLDPAVSVVQPRAMNFVPCCPKQRFPSMDEFVC